MEEIFISFSSKNSDKANEICAFLEQAGRPCFIASRDLTAGMEYAAQLVERLDEAKAVVLLLSRDSNDSPHVLREVEYAVSHKIPIIVYPLEEVELSKSLQYFLMTHQWLIDDENKDNRLLQCIDDLQKAGGGDCENAKFQPEDGKAADSKSQPEAGTTISVTNDATGSDEKVNKTSTESNAAKHSYIKVVIGAFVLMAVVFAGLFVRYILPELKTNSDEISKEVTDYQLGDHIVLGKYNDEAIDWRVIHKNEDGSLVLLSSEILTVKAFDTAEGGCYNEYDGINYWSFENHDVDDPKLLTLIRGNNDWSQSNIRTWLNSDKEIVEYKDRAPTKKASCSGGNFYSNEPGFLFAFSDEEKAALVQTANRTKGNVFSTDAKEGYVETKDLVWLLSNDELTYLSDAGIPIYARITDSAVEKDTENYVKTFFETYAVDNYYWWLRDPAEKVNEGYIVTTDCEDEDTVMTASVGATVYGIRPAICVSPKLLPDEGEESDR